MDIDRADVDIFEFLNMVNTFEHNEDCTVRIDNGGIFNEPRIRITASFKNKNGRNTRMVYDLTKRQLLGLRGKNICDVIKNILYYSIKPDMDEAKGLQCISWDYLMLKAGERDYIRHPIIEREDGKITIYTHNMPSFTGDRDYIDYDEWYSLFCVIENDVISDTYVLDSKYLNYRVMDIDLKEIKNKKKERFMKVKDLLKNVEDVELTPEQEKQIKDYLGIKDNKRYVPKYGEDYFYLDSYLSTDNMSTFTQNSIDYSRIAIGNCFETEEEAEFAAEKIRVYQELKLFADENNSSINWESDFYDIFTIFYDHSRKCLNVTEYKHWEHVGSIYFSSERLAYNAIKKVGEDRIKKYLFGVE